MSLEKVNVLGVELDHKLDRDGFRHLGTALGGDIGAARIGAGLYEADAGLPIWPYHYHHGVEEWLYVLDGAPVLREPAGERTLSRGDLVCFPSGHVGAHTVKGPGRFVIFSAGRRPSMSVYPDSDKASGPEGILLRSSAVDYWHGEGTAGPSEPVEIRREPKTSPPQPVVNALTVGDAPLGPLLGAERLDAIVLELDPGADSEPYHYVHGREADAASRARRRPARARRSRVLPGRPCRCSPRAQSQRLGRARAVPVDDGSTGECVLPGDRAVADPQRARRRRRGHSVLNSTVSRRPLSLERTIASAISDAR